MEEEEDAALNSADEGHSGFGGAVLAKCKVKRSKIWRLSLVCFEQKHAKIIAM